MSHIAFVTDIVNVKFRSCLSCKIMILLIPDIAHHWKKLAWMEYCTDKMQKDHQHCQMSSSMHFGTFLLLFDDFELFPWLFNLDQPQTSFLGNPTRCKDLICGRKEQTGSLKFQVYKVVFPKFFWVSDYKYNRKFSTRP